MVPRLFILRTILILTITIQETLTGIPTTIDIITVISMQILIMVRLADQPQRLRDQVAILQLMWTLKLIIVHYLLVSLEIKFLMDKKTCIF